MPDLPELPQFTPELVAQIEAYVINGPPKVRVMVATLLSQIELLYTQSANLEAAVVQIQALYAADYAVADATVKRIWVFQRMLLQLGDQEGPVKGELLRVIAAELHNCLLDLDPGPTNMSDGTP